MYAATIMIAIWGNQGLARSLPGCAVWTRGPTRVRACKDVDPHGRRPTGTRDLTDTQVHTYPGLEGYRPTGIRAYIDTGFHSYGPTQIQAYLGTDLHGYRGPHEHTVLYQHGHKGLYQHGRLHRYKGQHGPRELRSTS